MSPAAIDVRRTERVGSTERPVTGHVVRLPPGGGRRLAGFLTALGALLLALGAYGLLADAASARLANGAWCAFGLAFLLAGDAAGLGSRLAPGAPVEFAADGLYVPLFAHDAFHRRGDGRYVARSRLFRLPLGSFAAPNRLGWEEVTLSVALGPDGPEVRAWPGRRTPARGQLVGLAVRLAPWTLPDLADRVLRGSEGDLHVDPRILADVAGTRSCPRGFRSDATFGRCLAVPTARGATRPWFAGIPPAPDGAEPADDLPP